MLHVVPVLCLIFFVLFVELQLKKELHQIETEFRELKKSILENKEEIQFNRDLIDTHQHTFQPNTLQVICGNIKSKH